MKQSILSVYKENPGNYIFAGDGGFGKTVQLLDFQRDLLGQSIDVDGKREICIPVYIKLSTINRMEKIGDDFLLEKLADYFNDSTWAKGNVPSRIDGIRQMILNNEDYRFIFLLDGINEVIFRLGIDAALKNSIWGLISLCNRVNVIITSRSEANQERIRLFPTNKALAKDGICIEDYLYYYYMKDLDGQSVKKFVGQEVSPEMQKILSVPMMAKIYKNILERDSKYRFEQKSELMSHYLMQNGEQKIVSLFDDIVDLRVLLIEKIIPFIAFYVTLHHLEKKAITELTLDDLIKKYLMESLPSLANNLVDFKAVLDSMRVIDEDLVFSHQLYRDYFAAVGLCHITNESESISFLQNLNSALLYDKDFGIDLERRTQYLDLAEFLYSEVGNSLEFFMKNAITSDNLTPLILSENFYDQLSGVYDDLKERTLSSQIGWTAFRLLIKVKESSAIDELSVATKANSVFYCILNDNTSDMVGNDMEKPLELAEIVREYVENDKHRTLKDMTLKGKYFSNMGAYYTSKWVAPADYQKALLWHRKAFDFRIKMLLGIKNELEDLVMQSPNVDDTTELGKKINQLRKDQASLKGEVMESYRTIMSDYYHLGNMEMAYNTYLDAISFYLPGISPDEIYTQKNVLQEDFVERALGAVIARIQGGFSEFESLIHLAELQTAYVYRKCTQNLVRPNREELSSLLSKVNQLCEMTQDGCHNSFFCDYIDKIANLLTL